MMSAAAKILKGGTGLPLSLGSLQGENLARAGPLFSPHASDGPEFAPQDPSLVVQDRCVHVHEENAAHHEVARAALPAVGVDLHELALHVYGRFCDEGRAYTVGGDGCEARVFESMRRL